MKTTTSKSETYQQLIASLDWRDKYAATSARILLSKAQAIGLERDQAFELVEKFPAADYIRNNPHILPHAWMMVSQMFDPNRYMSDAEQILFESN
jgi:hypothetical protein